MDNIFENTQGNVSLELADFYNKSFMVNGDANLASFMPTGNPSIPDAKDDLSTLATNFNNQSKATKEIFSNPSGNFNDPFSEAKIYGFNPSFKGLNMDRYDDKELGFDPFRDNEKFYNDNTSMFYDFGRAFGGMGKLAYGAFVDSATSLGRMVQGDFDISKDFAMDSERIMAETMSTKGGFLPGVANFIVNTGFTVGMMSEMIAEEALIAGASLLLAPESGGTSLGAGGYLAALRAQMALTKVGAAWKGMGSLKKALTSLDDVNEARRYFTQFGKNTVDFLNPVRNTTDLFVGGNKLAGLGQMAQLSKGFGAFFRDVRDMNRSLSEARLEGGFVYNKMFDDLVNEHIERTGKEPSPQEIEGIKNIAHTAGISTELINLPVIHYTNNIVFGNLSKPLTKFIRGTDDTLKILGSRFDLVDNVWQEVGKGFGQSLRRGLNPRNIARNSLNYFSANLAEGLQESFQEATAIATEDYYKGLYFNENSLGKKLYELSWLDSYGKGIGAQFSAQGAEVFASGFLMGGVINNVSKALTKSINYVHETVSDKRAQAKAAKDPEFKIEYEKQKAEKEIKIAEAKKALVEGLNTLYSDPNKMFAPDLENMTAQEILDQKIRAAGANNDRKFLIDFTDESFFKHVSIAQQVGKFDSLIKRIEGRLALNNDELAQAMGVKDGAAARARLEVAIDRAKEIKKRYDLAPKNPIDLSRLKPNTPEYYEASLLKKSFDDAITDMVFSQASFDRKLERMENITRDFANVNVISNAPAAPLMHLFGASNMMREIDLLVSEIQSLDPKDPKSKKIIDEKTALLSKLNTLATKIDEFTEYDKETRASEEMAGEDIQNPKYAEAVREAFASYLEEYAKVNKGYVKADNLDNAFELLYDYYRLGNDADTLSRSVAVVSNPNFIREEASRKFNALKKIHENRKEYIQKSVDKFFELIGLNDVFSKLKDLGVAIHPQEALAFNLAQGNYKIKRFVKADTLEEIAESNPLMEKINKIMSDYQKEIGITAKEEAKAKAEEETKKEEEVKKEAEEAKKAETKPVDDILAGLDSKTVKELKDAYNDIERDDKESFEEFLDSPQAKRIIAKATRGKEPEEKAEVVTTKVPLNGIEGVDFGIDGVTLDGFTIDGNYYNVLSHYGRAKTLVNINGVIVPFYLTSGSGGKGLIPGWYPFAGIGQDGWLNKTGKLDMESYYSRLIGQENADLLKAIGAKLNEQYGTDPEVFKNPDADPTTTDKPISSLANKTEDYINSKLPFTPASNNTSETLIKFESNMTQLGEALTNSKITPKTETETQPEEAPAETKKESELPGNIEPVKPEVEAELTEEEVNILVDLEPKSPFAELDPLYSADEFILTEDGKFYFNQSKPKQKAKRVSELKPEFSGDKRKGAIAAERGNIIDFLIRRFFEDRITADNINSAAEAFRKAYGKKKITFEPGFFDQMFKSFQLIKEEFDQKGWTIVSNLPTLFGTLGVDLYAGTTDLLARDKDGNYFIIDLKTSGSSRRADYEKQLLGESNYGYSTADRIQQNAYRELLKQRTGIEVKGLFILPLIVDGNIGIISGKFNSVELDTPADGSYLLPIDMSKNIYEIVPDKFTFEQVEQIEQEFPVSPQVVGKIVYASPGIGKSTLVSQYPNQFVDMDQLLAEEFTSLGYEGFTADNVGSKVYDLFRTADYDEVKSIVDNAYRNAFDRAKEMTKTGVTVLTGSPRFLVGKGSMRYVDLAVIASDESIIRKQLERKNPTATPQEITDLVNRIRTDEKNANVLIEVNSDEFINFIQGTLPISSYIINANTNSQILNLEKLISVEVSEEDLANFMAKKQLMLDRKQMFEQVEAGDIVELSINDGKDTVALVVDRVIPYYKNQTKILFKPNSNKIKDLIPAKSFSIVSVSKANTMPTKPDVSEEAEKNAKDNVTKMDDFTSETDRLKKLLEEDFNEDDLFNGAEDPDNCNI